MVLPKIECEASTKNYGRFSISPLETGYGVTIGNALRRVLLSVWGGREFSACGWGPSRVHSDPGRQRGHDYLDPEY
jgi:hypothetical protein